MGHGIAILILLVYFIIVAIFLTILWRISSSLDNIARDIKKLADKSEK